MFSAFKWCGSYAASAKVLFPICLVLLCVSTIYILNEEGSLPFLPKPDLCLRWKEVIYDSDDGSRIEDKQWLEWACRLEKEWGKGNEYECEDKRKISNYEVCFDPPYKPSSPCLVYSFGIDHDFSFDDKMAQLGCEVYSFDPNMNVKSHNRSKRVHFLNLGLGLWNSDIFTPKKDEYTKNSNKKWQIKTLPAIKRMLSHQDMNLDVLKMDIETYEWKIIQQLLEDGSLKYVKQLLIEWHILPREPVHSDFPVMFQTYIKLKEKGWRQFYTITGPRRHRLDFFRSQMDNGLVNTMYETL